MKGVSTCGLLTVAFVVLKLRGVIGWGWGWILSPLWIPWAVAFFVTGLFGVLYVFLKVIADIAEARK